MIKLPSALILTAALALATLTAQTKPICELRAGTLYMEGRAVLRSVPDNFSIVEDPTGAGVFLKFSAQPAESYRQTPLGQIAGLQRFTSCHRVDPFWMVPVAGTNEAGVALETQWLLAETTAGDCVMMVPLLDKNCRFALSGNSHGLNLTAETGDPAVTSLGGVAVFVSVGKDPYQLADDGAVAVIKKLGTGKLRSEKPLPDFVNDFGWCTWNSFYKEVSEDKVRQGLSSFAAGKVEPRFMILDDGWQDYRKMPSGEERLVSLAPNQKRFSGDLTPTVQLVKRDFKIHTFLVWHALLGYWGGVDGKALPGYGVKETTRSFNQAILDMNPTQNQSWGNAVGLVSTDRIGKFYDDYHQRLVAQGVDGVKVDNQGMIEGVAHGMGGRGALAHDYRQALETSVTKHFSGRLINCMANSMETYYDSTSSTLMRTSTDFWPNDPESHGAHMYCNAQLGVWFGEFMQPDWDMFQSDHVMGSFHAAGRAVSGGPVYVSDAPGKQNFDLLRKLVLSDGTILRAKYPGRPTRDCLFADVVHEPVLLKIFNFNRDCGVIGVFNSNYHPNATDHRTISGTVSPSDIPGLKGDDFAGYSQNEGKLWRCGKNDRNPIALAEGRWEIVSYAPVDHGVAVLGLGDKLNSTGAVSDKHWNADGSYGITLSDGGKLVAWAEHSPQTMKVNGKATEFSYNETNNFLTAILPASGKVMVTLEWKDSGNKMLQAKR